jgi:hypothetical protein
MVAAIRNDQSLGQALAERAKRASMFRLLLDVVGGLVAFGIIVAWRPEGWAIPASAALCFATFGAWGAADRLLESPYRITNNAIAASLLILRTFALVVGVGAALVIVFGSLEIAMGTFIH